MLSMWTGWLLALALGFRHASEPDHIVAVSTLVAERGRASSFWLGAVWGIGHTLSLLAVGGLLLVTRLNMPEMVAKLIELAVSLMLIALGLRAFVRAYRAGRSGKTQVHTHAAHAAHVHSGPDDHVHVGAWTMARRPLLIGLVHGLAGSGALTALALANMPAIGPGLIYMLMFGVGSIAGMAAVTGVVGWPLERMQRSGIVLLIANMVAGASSFAFGAMLGVPIVLELLHG